MSLCWTYVSWKHHEQATKQYWFTKPGELRCMVREFGTHTLFLTFSCAEYESHDIIVYLRKVNNVSDSSYNEKLCTEDPVSISRQFSNKFYVFFKKVLLNENVLGIVSHYFKKRNTKTVVHPFTMFCCRFKMHQSLMSMIHK